MELNSFVRRARTALALGLVGSAIAMAAGAAPASASLGLACPSATSTPFVTWKDYANYAFAPDGGFESGGSGWTLSGGARGTSGNESYFVHNSRDKASLSLPKGASATSPGMCISLLSSKMRFLVRGSSAATPARACRFRSSIAAFCRACSASSTAARSQPAEPGDPRLKLACSAGLCRC